MDSLAVTEATKAVSRAANTAPPVPAVKNAITANRVARIISRTGSQARAGVRTWMEFYNYRRPHKALGGRPPAVVYSLTVETTQPDQQEQIRA
ncbi:MAG: hypothetical protein DI498_06865 [Paracoccus denitrificans]|nr:MAG: hypothetical protein DI498_06865 [Paracoccus denitrificans]PZO84799.1 MAG: hypothetical protein DI633_06865 [Paracoccus denitrificans]